jgi:hypothetical protein
MSWSDECWSVAPTARNGVGDRAERPLRRIGDEHAPLAVALLAEPGEAPLAQREVLRHGLGGPARLRHRREAGLGEVERAEERLERRRIRVVREEDAHRPAPLAREEVVERVRERGHDRAPAERAAVRGATRRARDVVLRSVRQNRELAGKIGRGRHAKSPCRNQPRGAVSSR